jgi:hypothetical protein
VRAYQNYEAESLKITMYGEERTFIEKDKTTKHTTGNRQEIIDMEFVIASFNNKPLKRGDYSFPFSLKLPEWLPASRSLNSSNISKMVIKYSIRT